jgi:hypothetical protein
MHSKRFFIAMKSVSSRRLCCLLLGFLLGSFSHLAAADFQDHEIVPEKELLITDPQVVDSEYARYPGGWSFGHLMEQALSREEASAKVAAWLEVWLSGKLKIGNDTVDTGARIGLYEKIIQPWQRKDGYREGAGMPWKPNFANAPFRLLAIVNRMDLALPDFSLPQATGGYGGGTALATRENGEARLIFGLVDENGKPLEKGLTLIFEYGLNGNDEAARLDWALAWHALGKRAKFDEGYRDELLRLTRCFTDREVKAPVTAVVKKPDGVIEHIMARRLVDHGQLLRIRSNDGVGGAVREFREFEFDGKNLVPVVLKSSPLVEFYDRKNAPNRDLARWLEDDARKARAEWQKAVKLNRDPTFVPVLRAVVLPEQIKVDGAGKRVSGFASTAADEGTHWSGWGLGDDALRREISLQSCCGCHCGDTNTNYYHIAPREEGKTSVISQFLRMDGSTWSIKDPDSKDRIRSQEMEDRKKFFASLLDPNMSVSEKRKLRDARQLRVH